MVSGGAASWNVRDQHMFDTLGRLMGHYGSDSKAIVWEHNTHIGDARYTDMADVGMFNIGQLVRQEHGDDGVVLVGLGGYQGSVTAADLWDGDVKEMTLPEAAKGSTEAMLHKALPEQDAALFVFGSDGSEPSGDYGRTRSGNHGWARADQGHRAVGVVYRPEYDKRGNYVPTTLDGRYDAFLWFRNTSAPQPLEQAKSDGGELETWPEGQ